jgi:hypothetical protein
VNVSHDPAHDDPVIQAVVGAVGTSRNARSVSLAHPASAVNRDGLYTVFVIP